MYFRSATKQHFGKKLMLYNIIFKDILNMARAQQQQQHKHQHLNRTTTFVQFLYFNEKFMNGLLHLLHYYAHIFSIQFLFYIYV